MTAKMINIKTLDGLCDTYVTFPDGQAHLPIIIFYMDAVGLRQRLYDMADRIAAEGFFVMAPNIFYRSRKAPIVDYETMLKPDKLGEMFKQVMAMAAELTPDLSQKDVKSFLAYAREQPQVDPHKVGAVGYCMGGGQALRAASSYPADFQAIATYHAGRLATDTDASPHHRFGAIKAEVYIAHADNDTSMPPEMIDKVKETLDEAQVTYHAELYQGAAHGWTMSDLPAYNEAAEKKHWDTLFELFKRVL